MASQFSQDIEVENAMTSSASASCFTSPAIVTSSLSGRSFAVSFWMNSDCPYVLIATRFPSAGD
jgi:hypothetical protein